jgi:hypothetical protein
MAHYAILNEDNVVATIVAADLIDGVKAVFPNHKIILSTAENPASVEAIYDDKTEKFIAPTTESNTDTIE